MTVNEVQAITGCGIMEIKEGLKLWPTHNPLLAAYYMMARSHAINVKGDRDVRDREWAKQRIQWAQ